MAKATQTHRCLAILLLLLCPFVLSGCMPVVVVREVAYRPSPSDPYELWRALITDSGLLLLCGSVDNGRESMEGVVRYYNLALRLEETLDPQPSDEIQVVQINDHPSLEMIKGYPSDLCQFDKKASDKEAGRDRLDRDLFGQLGRWVRQGLPSLTLKRETSQFLRQSPAS